MCWAEQSNTCQALAERHNVWLSWTTLYGLLFVPSLAINKALPPPCRGISNLQTLALSLLHTYILSRPWWFSLARRNHLLIPYRFDFIIGTYSWGTCSRAILTIFFVIETRIQEGNLLAIITPQNKSRSSPKLWWLIY